MRSGNYNYYSKSIQYIDKNIFRLILTLPNETVRSLERWSRSVALTSLSTLEGLNLTEKEHAS